MRKLSKQEVSTKITNLITKFAAAQHELDQTRRELERVISRAWVDQLQQTLEEDRAECDNCKLDVEEFEVNWQGLCYSCEMAQRSANVEK